MCQLRNKILREHKEETNSAHFAFLENPQMDKPPPTQKTLQKQNTQTEYHTGNGQ